MILDEAIKHAEEVAEENERLCNQIHPSLQWKNYGKCAEEHRQLAEWLKELKQLREQTRWIPVSERLPKIASVYRVTRYYPNNVMNPEYLVDACFFDGSNTWYNDNRINHDRAYVDNVIAWQEDPEPYKVEPQEGGEKVKDALGIKTLKMHQLTIEEVLAETERSSSDSRRKAV